MTFMDTFETFTFHTSDSECIRPCTTTTYKIDLKYSHENSWTLFNNDLRNVSNVFRIFFFYQTLTVEEKIETLLYDVGGLMATAGGNLGLCLGFSCLSILYAAISWISFAVVKLKGRFTFKPSPKE